jgi:hypothetical protein
MQNPLFPQQCPACGDYDFCHETCICPACERNGDAYAAWKALAPVMHALNAQDIAWSWAVDTVMPTALERYSLDLLVVTKDTWSGVGVYANADGSFTVEHFFSNIVNGAKEIDSEIVWRGDFADDCATAVAQALGRRA